MAITFHTQPQVFTPGSNPVVWTFSSDETAQPNFSYIVEVYVNAILHSTHQVFPQNGIYAKFNASEIARGLLSSPLLLDGTLVTLYSSAFDIIDITVYEQYGTPPAIEASDSSNSKYVFNAALRHPDFVNWDYMDYNITTTNPLTAIPYLTSWPRTYKYFCGLNEKVFLGFISNDSGLAVDIRLYNSANALIASSLGNVITFQQLTVLDASPQTLINSTSLTSGDFTNCVYYTVRTNATGIGPYIGRSEVFSIYIDTECQRYPSKRLHWLNKFGVWDSFTFDLVSTDSTKVEGNRYEKEKGVWKNYFYKGSVWVNAKNSTFKPGDNVSPFIAPMAVMICNRLTFVRSRSVKTGKIKPTISYPDWNTV